MGNIPVQANTYDSNEFSGFRSTIYKQKPPPKIETLKRNTPGFDYLNGKAYYVFQEGYISDKFKFGARRPERFSSEMGFNLHNREGFSKHSLSYPLKLGSSCNLDLSAIINSNKEIVPSITVNYSDVMFSVIHSFNTLNEQKSLQVESKFRNSFMNVGFNSNFTNFNTLTPIIRGEGILNIQGWLTGISTTFDSGTRELISHSFAFGDEDGNVIFNSCLSDGEKFQETVYLRVSDDCHTAFSVAWSSREDSSCVSVGCKLELPSGYGTLGVKLNNFGVLSLSRNWRPVEGVTVDMSCSVQRVGLVECGFGIELEI